MAELRDAGAVGFSDDGLPISNARVLRRALSVPAAGRSSDRAPRGGPRPLPAGRAAPAAPRRRDARGTGVGRPRPGRHPLGRRVDDDRPGRRAGRLRGRPGSRPAPVGARVGGRRGGGEAGGGRDQLRGDAAPPDADRRGGQEPRRALQDEPAASLRGRPPGADRRTALRRDRLRRHRPRAAFGGREGGPVRGGGDGGDRAGDGIRGPAHRPGPAGSARAGRAGRPDERRRGPVRARATRPGSWKRGEPGAVRPRGRVGGGRRGLGEPLPQLLLRRSRPARAGC